MTRIHILIPVYNAKDYILGCLNSCYNQTYKATSIVIVDDASTDGTSELIQEWLVGKRRCKYHRKPKNTGSPLDSIVLATKLSNAQPNDIITNVDGDDELFRFALKTVKNTYNDSVWLTYGTCVVVPEGNLYADTDIINTATCRKNENWKASHLRTYRKWLFDKILDSDLRNSDGNYFKCSGDQALMYPMVEMAGNEHIVNIKRVIYKYNSATGNNENVRFGSMQMECESIIRGKQEYQAI